LDRVGVHRSDILSTVNLYNENIVAFLSMLKCVKYAWNIWCCFSILLAHALENTLPFLNQTDKEIYLIMRSRDVMVVDFYFKFVHNWRSRYLATCIKLAFFLSFCFEYLCVRGMQCILLMAVDVICEAFGLICGD
jgi:hypothetical protein